MHENERKEFIDKYKEKNPQAFTPKIEDKVKLAQRQNVKNIIYFCFYVINKLKIKLF